MAGHNPLSDAIARWEQVHQGLLNAIQPLSLRELNHAPDGRAAMVRQLAHHLSGAPHYR